MSTSFRVAQINTPPGVIDLGRGDPQFSLLPLELLRQAAERRLRDSDNAFLQYGTEQGDGYFRRALAGFLSDGYRFSVDPDTLFVTSGISSALDLLCTLFTKPGDTVFVEEPSYFLALRIFADHGLRLVSVPTDSSGIIIEALQQALNQHHPKFLYLIPAFQNPSGCTLIEQRRQRLLALARQHDLLLLADEVYQFLNYTVQPPASFGAYVDNDLIISLGSFSKILAPGLRLGWLQANPKTIQRIVNCGLLDSGGGMNPFTSAIVRSVLESGDLKRNISSLQQVYSRRVDAMAAALRLHMPHSQFATPEGGYFFWVRVPGQDAQELRRQAAAYQVDFRPGVIFSSQNGLRDYLRLGISFYEVGEIEIGIARLADCLRGF